MDIWKILSQDHYSSPKKNLKFSFGNFDKIMTIFLRVSSFFNISGELSKSKCQKYRLIKEFLEHLIKIKTKFS